MDPQRTSSARPCPAVALLLVAAAAAASPLLQADAAQGGATAACRISGRATSGGTPLPGVAIALEAGGRLAAATSTDIDGSYHIAAAPGAYRVAAGLTGFTPVEREIVAAGEACARTVDFELALLPRRGRGAANAAGGQGAGATRGTPTGRGGPGAGSQPAAAPFETLAVQEAAGALVLDAPVDRDAEQAAARQLLPPGFSLDDPSQAVAFTGNAASLDRDMLGERMDALVRGEFGAASGVLPPGFGDPAAQGAPGGFGRGGPGGRGAGGGPGGFGRGDFAIGGRGGRQNRFNATAGYTFGGSALDAEPYQLRPDSPTDRAPYTRQTFTATAGGPVRIPGVYDGTRRTSFAVTYSGNRGDELFDQYATVPTDALRAGDFASAAAQLVDPRTGQPFPGNRIPADAISPTALALLRFIPSPTLDGPGRNFHYVTTTDSLGDSVSARVTHNFTPPPAGGRGAGGRGGAFGGRGGLRAGRGGRGTTAVLNAQVQYRRGSNERLDVFPTLGGRIRNSSLAVPLSFNLARRGTLHQISVNTSRTRSASRNQYAGLEDVAGGAGIAGVASDPFDWGVPELAFGTFTSVRDLDPSTRVDRRASVSYTWSRPAPRHTLRIGGDYRWDRSSSRTDPDARGAFVFTGLYASGGVAAARSDGLDFADFLLGLPQQARVQYGPGEVTLTGRSMSLFVQDDWRPRGGVTVNAGLRYELLRPFVEEHGQMVNLDPAPGFSAVAPVVSGGTGAYSGPFPRALLDADTNNIAPRLGVAWRPAPGTVVRGGYGVSFNAGSYASIARQMVGQPPFAVSNTATGTPEAPLSLADPLATASPDQTTNNYGVEREYALGTVQTWNADVSRDLRQVWNVGGGYTHTRGAHLDIVRAPNRGPDGLRIPGVQPFLWQASEGASVLHAATFRARRRPARGIGAAVTYTLARSRDNASTIGGGGTVVAQDDRNLDAEWGLSSFDRRHQLAVEANVELPFGPNRRWLASGGIRAALLENWRASVAFNWQSGAPYTPRVVGAAADVARGTNGTLRANYDGGPVQVPDPAIDLFFNTAAFSVPPSGTFGDAGRNMIIGPGSRQLNAQFARDIRLGGTRALTLQLNATNLLNMVNYAAIDTTVNSPTFGHVLSVRPMRSMRLTLRFRF